MLAFLVRLRLVLAAFGAKLEDWEVLMGRGAAQVVGGRSKVDLSVVPRRVCLWGILKRGWEGTLMEGVAGQSRKKETARMSTQFFEFPWRF